MKPNIKLLAEQTRNLLSERPAMADILVLTRGNHLILAREEVFQPGQPPVQDERLRLTCLKDNHFGLSTRDWRGKRWEPTPYSGNLNQLLDIIETYMPHLIARWADTSPKGE